MKAFFAEVCPEGVIVQLIITISCMSPQYEVGTLVGTVPYVPHHIHPTASDLVSTNHIDAYISRLAPRQLAPG